MLNKVKAWIHSKRLMNNDTSIYVVPTVQEDTRAIEAVKRVRKAFDQQSQAMNARALKRHQCANPDLCNKNICFKHVPDKIVDISIDFLKTKEVREKELSDRIKIKQS